VVGGNGSGPNTQWMKNNAEILGEILGEKLSVRKSRF
jgi:hypothetical protein